MLKRREYTTPAAGAEQEGSRIVELVHYYPELAGIRMSGSETTSCRGSFLLQYAQSSRASLHLFFAASEVKRERTRKKEQNFPAGKVRLPHMRPSLPVRCDRAGSRLCCSSHAVLLRYQLRHSGASFEKGVARVLALCYPSEVLMAQLLYSHRRVQ